MTTNHHDHYHHHRWDSFCCGKVIRKSRESGKRRPQLGTRSWWGFLSGLSDMPMVVFTYNHVYRVRSAPNESIQGWRWGTKTSKTEQILLGELAKLCLNAAMPHAHPGQSRTDISGCPWKWKTTGIKLRDKHEQTPPVIPGSTGSRWSFTTKGTSFFFHRWKKIWDQYLHYCC